MYQTLLLEPLANGLILFYKLLGGNLGLAIVAFSVFLRLILNPLTKPYMESMKKMKEVAPQLEKLKKKHKNDKMKMASAQSELYRQKGIKPGAGCLPYLLQIIILIAFFNVFNRTLTAENPTGKFNELLYPPLLFAEDQTINTKFLYLDITKPDSFDVGLPFQFPGPILILAAAVQFLSSKIMTPAIKSSKKAAKKTPGEADDMQAAMQQSMIYTFPLLTIVFGLQFPSGLAIYWLMFSLMQFWQQYKTQGWGGLSPWINRLGLLQSKN